MTLTETFTSEKYREENDIDNIVECIIARHADFLKIKKFAMEQS